MMRLCLALSGQVDSCDAVEDCAIYMASEICSEPDFGADSASISAQQNCRHIRPGHIYFYFLLIIPLKYNFRHFDIAEGSKVS